MCNYLNYPCKYDVISRLLHLNPFLYDKCMNNHKAPSIKPPYYAVIFSSLLSGEDDEGYQKTALQMEALATQQSGFLGLESARDNQGMGITVSYWKDLQSIEQWKQHIDHLSAQAFGKSTWYQHYSVKISRVERCYGTDSTT